MKNLLTLLFFFFAVMTVQSQTILFEENFDGGIPGDWVQVTDATDGGWKAGTAAGLSSLSYPIADNGTGQMMGNNEDACNCDKLSDRIIMPPVDLSGVSAAVLKFNSYYQALTYQGATESAFVEASTDGGMTWDVLTELPISDTWSNDVFVSLASYVGNSQVWVSFHYSDGGGWTYGVAVDEVSIFEPNGFDIKFNTFGTSRFQLSGQAVNIIANITNLGSENLTSFDFSWSDGTNTYTETVTGLNVGFGASADITHPTPFNVANPITYDISVWGDNPNGEVDSDQSNNNTNGVVSGVTYIPAKKMFAEEATGTWCGWCPRGTEWMDYMSENYPDDFVGVAVHNSDPMVLTAYDNGVGAFPGFQGYPSVILDRTSIIDPSALEVEMAASLAAIAPVAPTITSAVMTVEDMTISLEGNAEFVTQLADIDYRLNFALTEDHVTGTGADWNQTNYYSTASANVPDPIPGYGLDWNAAAASVSGVEYNHVGRWLSDGWAGEAGSVASSVVAGDQATKSFSGDFNADWNPFNMHAIIMVLDNATGQALNTNSVQVEVICPADLAQTIDVTDTNAGLLEGAINVTMANPALGFGGYTYTLNSGETANVGTPITGLAAGDYTVTIMDAIGCSKDFTVTVASIVGTNDIEALTNVTLFPNPTSNTTTLTADFSELVDLKVTVMNNIGQVIEATQFDQVSSVQHEINVAELPAGLYLVKMNVNDQVRTHRLMVK
jgi:Secretion system C-terminal sorting domain/Outer membrane protein Omp28